MGKVALLLDLEAGFGVMFPEEDVVPATFESADSLWSVLARVASVPA